MRISPDSFRLQWALQVDSSITLYAHDLGYLSDSDYEELTRAVGEIKQMLASFIQKLKADR